MSANKMLEMEIRAAYIFLREKNHTIPSDTLQFMLDASLEKLNSVEYNEVLDPVSKSLPSKNIVWDAAVSFAEYNPSREYEDTKATFIGGAEWMRKQTTKD